MPAGHITGQLLAVVVVVVVVVVETVVVVEIVVVVVVIVVVVVVLAAVLVVVVAVVVSSSSSSSSKGLDLVKKCMITPKMMLRAGNLAHMGEMINRYWGLVKNVKERDAWDLGVEGRIILKWILTLKTQN